MSPRSEDVTPRLPDGRVDANRLAPFHEFPLAENLRQRVAAQQTAEAAEARTPQGELTLFANPFLSCERCGARVEGARLGQPGPVVNQPCGHAAPMGSRCPSWGPVDGCRCPEHLGDPRHVPEPATLAAT